MGCVHMVEEHCIFNFCIMADHTIVATDKISAYVSSMANHAVFSNPARPLYISPRFNDRPLSNVNTLLIHDKGSLRNFCANFASSLFSQVIVDLGKDLPNFRASCKKRGVLIVREVEKIIVVKNSHGGILPEDTI